MDIDSSLQTMNDMKKNIFRLVAVVALAGSLAACKKETAPYADEQTPTLSLTSPSSSFVQDQASIVLELSHFIHKDVVVTFGVEGIESEALDLPIEYTVEAGALKKTIPITVDEDFASLGNKTVRISVQDVTNATLGSKEVSLGIDVRDVAVVNMSATDFVDGVATLTFTLSKKVTQDVVLGLEALTTGSGKSTVLSADRLTFDKTVTIPAGSKVGTLKVQADTYGLAEGAYEAAIGIASFGSNAEAGASTAAYASIGVGFNPKANSTGNYFIYYSGYWYVYRSSAYSYFIWMEPASSGSLTDMAYVKEAMYRCRDYIRQEANRKAYLAYYVDGYSSYAGYIPTSIPQVTADKTGYWGWPIEIKNGKLADPASGTAYNCIQCGFTQDLELVEDFYGAVIDM